MSPVAVVLFINIDLWVDATWPARCCQRQQLVA